MVTSRAYTPLAIIYTSLPESRSPPMITKDQVGADDTNVIQGRMFWLPFEEELPRRAVRRAHGKGVVEGIHGHPVVVISRPADQSHIVHFHVVSATWTAVWPSLTLLRYRHCTARRSVNYTTSRMISTFGGAPGIYQ
jgi:hypothetical protein